MKIGNSDKPRKLSAVKTDHTDTDWTLRARHWAAESGEAQSAQRELLRLGKIHRSLSADSDSDGPGGGGY